jgi:hypothetical protein
MKDWKEIESKARQIADQTIKINDRLSLIQMASGGYRPAIDGNQTEPSELSGEDLNAIRSAFGIPERTDFDGNPLIPDMAPTDHLPKKEKKDPENPFDQNPLIP